MLSRSWAKGDYRSFCFGGWVTDDAFLGGHDSLGYVLAVIDVSEMYM